MYMILWGEICTCQTVVTDYSQVTYLKIDNNTYLMAQNNITGGIILTIRHHKVTKRPYVTQSTRRLRPIKKRNRYL